MKRKNLMQIIEDTPLLHVEELRAIQEISNFKINQLNNRRERMPLTDYIFQAAVACYIYGVMQGKRKDRARRRGDERRRRRPLTEKAAYGRGHVAGGEAQDLPQKKSEQFQYIPTCPPRKEAESPPNDMAKDLADFWSAQAAAAQRRASAAREAMLREHAAQEAMSRQAEYFERQGGIQ